MKDARAKIKICFFLIVTTFFIYAQIKDHEFTNIDDSIHCCLRVYLAGLTTENIKWAFATFSTGNWFPVTFFSHI